VRRAHIGRTRRQTFRKSSYFLSQRCLTLLIKRVGDRHPLRRDGPTGFDAVGFTQSVALSSTAELKCTGSVSATHEAQGNKDKKYVAGVAASYVESTLYSRQNSRHSAVAYPILRESSRVIVKSFSYRLTRHRSGRSFHGCRLWGRR
jgi:hypothetical protein